MQILVTGGLGYIGSHTCVKLIEAGFTPIILDNLSNSKRSVLERIKTISGVSPDFYQGDIRDKTLLNTIFTKYSISAVIHFAGLKSVGESVQKPLEYYDVNVSGSLCLAEMMKEHNVKNLIFSSSATVYGSGNKPPFLETLPTGNTTNPYGTSKLMVERCLMDLFIADPNWSMTLLRYFNPVGAHPSGLMGEDPRGIPNNLMPYISQVAVGKRDFLSVYGDDYLTSDGTGIRDYIHVDDLAMGHVLALKRLNESGVHIYNLGTGQGNSVLEVISAYEKVCGRTISYRVVARRDGDVAASFADAKKAKQELNWEAKYTLDDMVNDSWRWQSMNPDGYPDD